METSITTPHCHICRETQRGTCAKTCFPVTYSASQPFYKRRAKLLSKLVKNLEAELLLANPKRFLCVCVQVKWLVPTTLWIGTSIMGLTRQTQTLFLKHTDTEGGSTTAVIHVLKWRHDLVFSHFKAKNKLLVSNNYSSPRKEQMCLVLTRIKALNKSFSLMCLH